MKDYIPKIKNFFSVKMILSIISIGGILPLSQVLYWTFETSYFGYFGISPEIFNRPVFSSGFIGVWLFAESIQPVFLVWSFLMGGFLFVLLVIKNMAVYFTSDQFKLLNKWKGQKRDESNPE